MANISDGPASDAAENVAAVVEHVEENAAAAIEAAQANEEAASAEAARIAEAALEGERGQRIANLEGEFSSWRESQAQTLSTFQEQLSGLQATLAAQTELMGSLVETVVSPPIPSSSIPPRSSEPQEPAVQEPALQQAEAVAKGDAPPVQEPARKSRSHRFT